MPYREFDDVAGARWLVWNTVPSKGAGLSSGMETGWLTFESKSERRRIAPIPEGWAELSDERLELLLRIAAPAIRRQPHTVNPLSHSGAEDENTPEVS